ncbi:serine protease 1-like [Channa argus]|uniref:serine protease 1-like n=1 Tax=Channa argus TaxID=215402 RepID=UPI0035228E04
MEHGASVVALWTIYAVVGVHPGPGQRVEILSEPRIYRDTNNNVHDIMLLKLPYPTNIQSAIAPDCAHLPQLGDKVYVAGHGSTTAGFINQRLPGQTASLHCGDLDVVPCTNLLNNLRNTHVQDWNYFHYQSIFCGHSLTVDVCKGDSGGAVVFNDRIYGVISFGNPTQACVDGSGFIKICQQEYLIWIHQTVANP